MVESLSSETNSFSVKREIPPNFPEDSGYLLCLKQLLTFAYPVLDHSSPSPRSSILNSHSAIISIYEIIS
jgi:hypothetical protein